MKDLGSPTDQKVGFVQTEGVNVTIKHKVIILLLSVAGMFDFYANYAHYEQVFLSYRRSNK